jgi:hypothetical protein
LFVLPFLISVVFINGKHPRPYLLYSCCATAFICQMYFLTLELMQIKVKGFKNYFYEGEGDLDMSNVVDMLSISFGIAYSILRVMFFEKVKCFMIIKHMDSDD